MTTALEGVRSQRHAPALFTPRKDLVPIVQEAGWVPGPVWTGGENLASTGIRSPDRSARSQSLYRLSYPANIDSLRLGTILNMQSKLSVRRTRTNCCSKASGSFLCCYGVQYDVARLTSGEQIRKSEPTIVIFETTPGNDGLPSLILFSASVPCPSSLHSAPPLLFTAARRCTGVDWWWRRNACANSPWWRRYNPSHCWDY